MPGHLVLAAATASASTNPRLPLPSRRRTTSDRSRSRLPFVLAGLATLAVTLAISTPSANSLAWFLLLAVGPACATMLMLFDDERALERPAHPFLLPFGALLASATIVVWLANDHPGMRVLLCLPWLAIAVLLRRGVGIAAPRWLLWLPTLLLLAAALLWFNLFVTVQLHPVTHWYGRIDVVTGWPWPVYIGAIRGGGAPTVTTEPAALWLDYAAMLGIAAILLWRRSTAWLVRWLPRLCAVMAIAHVVGGFRLAFATDG